MKGTFSDHSESQEEEILQPIAKFYPANEIITKDYPGQQKPILKLIRKHEKPQIQTCQQLKKHYRNLFESQDTLGYNYSVSLLTNLVYLKFNNQNYLRLKTKNNVYKFLSGMFIPTDKILAPQTKNSKNIYKTLSDIEFTQYKNSQNIDESFGKNCKNPTNRDLRFSSNYDSANLFIAMKKKQFEYDLIIQNDINSKGNTQWFNFVTQFSQQGVYKFNLLNFTKSSSQYQDGMRIVYYSYKDHENGMGEWCRGCDAIKYEKSSISREDCDSKKYYVLKFQYTCTYMSDKVIFAYFYPYTGLELQKFLKKTLYRKINVHMRMEKIKVCETLSGLPIYAISIQHKKNHSLKPSQSTAFTAKNNNQKPNKSMIFMARQHPGQTQGSFLAEGIIQLLMENGEIDYLKRNIEFYVFPMVNADGVLYGNYRTNLAGTDLNRMWRNPRKDLQPQVYYIKKYLQIINKNAPISMIIDLHGHSKSLNSFFYGNPIKKQNFLSQSQDPRLFPYICSKKIKQISYSQSTFSISEDKKNSARVVLSQIFPKALVYTLQNSFHGWRKDRNTIHQYTQDILRKIGRELIITYLEYERILEKNPQIKEKWTKQISDMKMRMGEGSQNQKGQSDSEAEQDLITIPPPLQDKESDRNLFDEKYEIGNIVKKKQNKENFIQRNLIIKTNIEKKYNKYQRNLLSPDSCSPITLRDKKSIKARKSIISPSNQGFLSIVKIKTNQEVKMLNLKNFQFSSEETQRSQDFKFTKESVIDRLKKKRVKIQQAMNSCSGMKSFLRTMGIPLDKKSP